MKRLSHVWYLSLALLALAPIGLRLLTWWTPHVPAADRPMVEAGRTLFLHEWKPNDPLCPEGDGLGPVYNATSCLACHNQGGAGGGGGLEHNVTTFVVERIRMDAAPIQGVLHSYAVQSARTETLNDIHSALPAISRPRLAQLLPPPRTGGPVLAGPLHGPRGGRAISPSGPNGQIIASWPKNVQLVTAVAGVRLSQRNTPALFGAGLIDGIPDAIIIAGERKQQIRWGLSAAGDGTDLPVGKASRLPNGRIGHFGWKGQTATLTEFVRAACANELGLGNPDHKQPSPLGNGKYRAPGLDLTTEQCDQLTAFVTFLSRPEERMPALTETHELVQTGKKLFNKIGCADCHTADLGSVSGLYSDLLLHRMGQDLEGSGSSYGGQLPETPSPSPGQPSPADEWRTPPLWGVADSAPYLHDGRAATLEEAILLHGGQGARSVQRFEQLPPTQRAQLIEFLKTLRAP